MRHLPQPCSCRLVPVLDQRSLGLSLKVTFSHCLSALAGDCTRHPAPPPLLPLPGSLPRFPRPDWGLGFHVMLMNAARHTPHATWFRLYDTSRTEEPRQTGRRQWWPESGEGVGERIPCTQGVPSGCWECLQVDEVRSAQHREHTNCQGRGHMNPISVQTLSGSP